MLIRPFGLSCESRPVASSNALAPSLVSFRETSGRPCLRALDHVAREDHILGGDPGGKAVFIGLHPFAEGKQRGLAQLLDRFLGVEVGLVFLPGETDDDPVFRGVLVDLIVRDVLIDQAGLDDRLRRRQLILGRVHSLGRGKGDIHAAADVDPPANRVRALDPGLGHVAVLGGDTEE